MPLHIDIGTPNAKQRDFFRATSRFVAYGGARGGGKSWAVRRKALLLSVQYPGIKMLLLRRTYPELRENHVIPLAAELQGLAMYKESDKSFSFVNNSRLKLGYCDSDSDVLQYQGQEYDVIFLDEATQFTEYQFAALTACLRGANEFPKRMYLTCNPGGVGHAWVKRLFIDKQYRQSEQPDDYTFISAKVYDNPVLLKSSPGYVQMLENLPDGLREAWLDGNWDVFAGQYFTMWRRAVHVIQPFDIPRQWRRYATLDYGRDMLAAYLVAVDERGFSYVYKEVYGGRDNQSGENGQGYLVSEAAEKVLDMIGPDTIDACFAPPDLWNKQSQTGQSTAEIFAKAGLPLVRANNDRVQGWYDLAEWLKVIDDEQGQPTARLRIFDNCSNLIRCLPQVQHDDKRVNDVANEPHELTHSCDAIRYYCTGRPLPALLPVVYDEDEPDYDHGVDNFLNFGRRTTI